MKVRATAVLVAFTGLPAFLAAAVIPCPDNVLRIGVLSAFGPELDLLSRQTHISKNVTINGRNFIMGTLNGKAVVLSKTGKSMTNAAMAAEAMVSSFNIERILFSGIAGGVNPSLNIGDVVVPAVWSEYQEGYYAKQIKNSFPEPSPNPGIYDPAFPYGSGKNLLMFYPMGTYLANDNGPADQETLTVWMKSDAKMVEMASQISSNVTLEKCSVDIFTGVYNCLDTQPVVKVGGAGISGPTFVDNAEFRNYVWKTWAPDCVDMESAAVAHVASVHNIPFLIFRSLSDLAGGGPDANEIGTFLGLAANNAAKVLITFLQLPQ